MTAFIIGIPMYGIGIPMYGKTLLILKRDPAIIVILLVIYHYMWTHSIILINSEI